MLRPFAIALMAVLFAVPVRAQVAPPTAAPAKKATKPATKKPTAKPVAAPATDTGPCRLGVISAIEDRFEVDKFGVTIFETEVNDVPIESWALDELVLARVRAIAGADPTIHRISIPKSAFELYYHPKSRFLPDPAEKLPNIIRAATPTANCERYLVVTTFDGEVPGTHLKVKGVGTYNQGLGSLIRHSHLFANIAINVIDGRTYENIERPFANFGTNFAKNLRLTEDPLYKLENSDFPDPPSAAVSSATLRERTRTLVASELDRLLPAYLGAQ